MKKSASRAQDAVVRSPFPGMDPFIEASGLWEDFHNALIQEIKYALTPLVPDRYVVRTGERSYLVLLESNDRVEHSFQPDVSVAAPRGSKRTSKRGTTAVAELNAGIEPVTKRAFIEEEHRETFVDVFEANP